MAASGNVKKVCTNVNVSIVFAKSIEQVKCLIVDGKANLNQQHGNYTLIEYLTSVRNKISVNETNGDMRKSRALITCFIETTIPEAIKEREEKERKESDPMIID